MQNIYACFWAKSDALREPVYVQSPEGAKDQASDSPVVHAFPWVGKRTRSMHSFARHNLQ
jgi:hypothetical protein